MFTDSYCRGVAGKRRSIPRNVSTKRFLSRSGRATAFKGGPVYQLKRMTRRGNVYAVLTSDGNLVKVFVGRRCKSRARAFADRLNNIISQATLAETPFRSRLVRHWSGRYHEEGRQS